MKNAAEITCDDRRLRHTLAFVVPALEMTTQSVALLELGKPGAQTR